MSEPNYGDVALNLPPDWSRSLTATDPQFMLTTVGHVNGVADARLKADPGKRHQFRWNAANDPSISVFRSRHYSFVNKNAGWEKNEELWEWDGEGFIVHNGQRLMARDAEWYFKDLEEEAARSEREAKKNPLAEIDARLRQLEAGSMIEDERGQRLRPAESVEPQTSKRR